MRTKTLIGLLVGLALTGLVSAQEDDPFGAEDDPFADDEDPFAEYEDLAGPEGNLTHDDDADDTAADGDSEDLDADASDDKGAPGLGLVGLCAALGAALVVARRR